MREAVRGAPTPVRWLVFDAEAVTHVDATGVEALDDLERLLARDGITMLLARMKGPLEARLEGTSFGATMGQERRFPTVRAAVEYCVAQSSASGSGPVSRPSGRAAADGSRLGYLSPCSCSSATSIATSSAVGDLARRGGDARGAHDRCDRGEHSAYLFGVDADLARGTEVEQVRDRGRVHRGQRRDMDQRQCLRIGIRCCDRIRRHARQQVEHGRLARRSSHDPFPSLRCRVELVRSSRARPRSRAKGTERRAGMKPAALSEHPGKVLSSPRLHEIAVSRERRPAVREPKSPRLDDDRRPRFGESRPWSHSERRGRNRWVLRGRVVAFRRA